MGDEVDLHLAVLFCWLQALQQGVLDGINALVLGARDLDLRAQAEGLLHEAAPQVDVDVRLDLLLQARQVLTGLGEVQLVPHVDLLIDVPPERFVGVPVLLVQRPGHLGAELLNLNLVHGSHVSHDAVHSLCLGKGLLLGGRICRIDSALGQVNVSLVLVHSQHHDDLSAADAEKLRDRPDSALRQLTEQHHALLTVILQEADICSHVDDPLHLHHHDILQLRELSLIEATLRKAGHH
mmetsp:Transcript_52521/g.118270  ORF Transcript_52521/g.118270 Transcript_52521/m.118270 type:complete len:238 (-) Transcript_52521:59-772(-)